MIRYHLDSIKRSTDQSIMLQEIGFSPFRYSNCSKFQPLNVPNSNILSLFGRNRALFFVLTFLLYFHVSLYGWNIHHFQNMQKNASSEDLFYTIAIHPRLFHGVHVTRNKNVNKFNCSETYRKQFRQRYTYVCINLMIKTNVTSGVSMVLRPTRHIDHSGDKQMLKYYELFLRTRSGTLTYLSDSETDTT